MIERIRAFANLKNYMLIFGFLLLAFAWQGYWQNAPKGLIESLRFFLLALLFVIAFFRRKMSLWIFSAMVLGIEVGMDFPAFS